MTYATLDGLVIGIKIRGSGTGANPANASGQIGRNTGGINYAYTLVNGIIVDGKKCNALLSLCQFERIKSVR